MGQWLGRPNDDLRVVNPVFQNIFTDMTGLVGQHGGKCKDFALRWYDCLDAYGIIQGKTKCKDLLSDFQECHMQWKQLQRCQHMRDHRDVAWLMGNLGKGPKRQHHEPIAPSYDTFMPDFDMRDP